jgi:hypothetical protein
MLRDDDKFVSIVDMPNRFSPKCSIYQAFIACEPKHPIMKYALEITFSNIVTRSHDMFSSLVTTGPAVVGYAMNLNWNEYHTFKEIKPGEYSNGIRLIAKGLG